MTKTLKYSLISSALLLVVCAVPNIYSSMAIAGNNSDQSAVALNAATFQMNNRRVATSTVTVSLLGAPDPIVPIKISTTTMTKNISLAVLNFNSDTDTTLKGLTVGIDSEAMSGNEKLDEAVSDRLIFGNAFMKINGKTYKSSLSFSSPGMPSMTFTIPQISLPAHQNVQISIYTNIAADRQGLLDGAGGRMLLYPDRINVVDFKNMSASINLGSIGWIPRDADFVFSDGPRSF